MKWRKKLIIEPRIQFMIIGYSIFLAVLFLIPAFFVTSVIAESAIRRGIEIGSQTNLAYAEYASEVYYQILSLFIALIVGTVILGFGVGSVFSNRIAGPIYRLKMHFKKCRETGRLQPVEFRKGDFIQDVATEFNTMSASLSKNSPMKD